MQLGQLLFRGFQPRGDVDELAGQRVQPVARVDHQVAQLVEGLGLRLELPVGPRGPDDHSGQQVATLGRGLRHLVVELLSHVEGLRQNDFGRLDRLGERLGLRLTELLDGQLQLVVAGPHRVVDVDDDRARQVVEGVDGDRRQRVGVGRVHPLGGGHLGLVPLAPPPAAPQQQQCDQQQDDRADDQQRHQRQAGPGSGGAGGGQAVGGVHRGAGPVVAPQRRLDLVAPDVVDLGRTATGGRRRHQERIRAVLGGDGQDRVGVGQVADGAGVRRPSHRALRRERIHVDDPQPHVAVVVELVDGLLHIVQLPVVEHACVVGDVVGQPERRLGGGRRSEQGGGRQDGEQDAEQTCEAHERQM